MKMMTSWQSETFSALLSLCKENSSFTCDFPSQSNVELFSLLAAWTNYWTVIEHNSQTQRDVCKGKLIGFMCCRDVVHVRQLQYDILKVNKGIPSEIIGPVTSPFKHKLMDFIKVMWSSTGIISYSSMSQKGISAQI